MNSPMNVNAIVSWINHVKYEQKESANPSQIQLEIKVWNNKAVIESVRDI
jgi:hypothetical protein